jgi:hypothetical protein
MEKPSAVVDTSKVLLEEEAEGDEEHPEDPVVTLAANLKWFVDRGLSITVTVINQETKQELKDVVVQRINGDATTRTVCIQVKDHPQWRFQRYDATNRYSYLR